MHVAGIVAAILEAAVQALVVDGGVGDEQLAVSGRRRVAQRPSLPQPDGVAARHTRARQTDVLSQGGRNQRRSWLGPRTYHQTGGQQGSQSSRNQTQTTVKQEPSN